MPGDTSYVLLAPTPWDTPWQPAQNLADALASEHRVLYVDPPMSPLTPVRYGLRPTTWPAARSVLSRRLRRRGNVLVAAPLALPPVQHPVARRRSLPLIRAQLASAVRAAGISRPILLAWRGLPELAGVAGESRRLAFVMDHPAAGAPLLGRDPEELEREAAALCDNADVVVTTSRPMHVLLGERGYASELVPFGFPSDLRAAFDSAVEPREYSELPRPLLGYTGGIDDRLDFELIVALADRYANGSLVFVGAVSPRLSSAARAALASRPNIHLLGSRPRADLPAYVAGLDVALLPYRDSTWTRHQSPMKVWEYFYAGPPIVGVGSAELAIYEQPLLAYARHPREVGELVDAALAEPDRGREQRRRFALENTWEHRARQLDSIATAPSEPREPDRESVGAAAR